MVERPAADPAPSEGPGHTLVGLLEVEISGQQVMAKLVPEAALLHQGHKEALIPIHAFLADQLFLSP